MDVPGRQPLIELRLHRLGLGVLLGFEPPALEHVKEVGVAAGVELIGAIQVHAAVPEQASQRAVDDGGAYLALDVVADNRQADIAKPPRPVRIGGDEHRHAVDHGHPGLQASLGIMAHRLLRAHRQVADQDLGAGGHERLYHVHRLALRRPERLIVGVVRHVRRHTIENGPHLDAHARSGDGALKHLGAVGLGEDGLLQGLAYLTAVDVEGGDDLDVARAPVTDPRVHEPGIVLLVAPPVVLEPLNQRARTVSHPGDRDSDLAHSFFPLSFELASRSVGPTRLILG